ncbi:MAG: radical SAM family heme chaperone HemW [Bacteroidota bacterium]
MAGIYLHIPFCRKACIYCDFHFLTNLKGKAQLVAALNEELRLRQDFFLHPEPIETIYFGGGTPSVLTEAELGSILEGIFAQYPVVPEAEITLEANPEDLTPTYLRMLKAQGINRLSIGLQSFSAEQLQWMNRPHSPEQAYAAVREAQQIGLTNISLDLIFGLPHTSLESWTKALQTLISLEAPHLSLYALTLEEKTALFHQVKKGQTRLPEDEAINAQFLAAHEQLSAAGYDHYELSNYCRPGFPSRHNSAYWRGLPYLGVGPSAHSYDGKQRAWNLRNNARYVKALAQGQSPVEADEILSSEDRYHEYLMTQWRKKEGVHVPTLDQFLGFSWRDRYASHLASWQKRSVWEDSGDWIRLTPSGWLLSDQIIGDFFLT